MNTYRWGIFTTNYGRSAITLLDLFERGHFPNNEVAFLLYENLPSGAAEKAQNLNIPVEQVIKRNYANRAEYEKSLLQLCKHYQVDFIFLLGFSYLVKHDLLKTYDGRIINIHPSLLPSFKGKKAIQQALDYGVKVTGITTHFIDENLDEGGIIAQVPIEIGDETDFENIDRMFQDKSPQILKETVNKVTATNA